jgi:hypothetical protein
MPVVFASDDVVETSVSTNFTKATFDKKKILGFARQPT